ncbi:MAG: 50S ribosomal protein L21 [Alphaproteobacteria bacterium]|nr:50S ribosomal protein L21 [Alphaproteobacteria bacterium]
MFAVIKTGGKQYKVAKDSVIVVEKLAGEAGSAVSFNEVLMAGDKVGTPFVEGATVSGEIVKQTRGEKVIIFKKIRRHGYRRKKGHKQDLTVVKITDVKA